jgi:hypothetical protein
MQRKIVHIIFWIFLLLPFVFGQELSSSFEVQSKVGKKTKEQTYILSYNQIVLELKDSSNYPFNSVLFEINPSQNKYDLLLLSAKREFQFEDEQNNDATVTIDGNLTELPKYVVLSSNYSTKLAIEFVGVTIAKDLFDKMARAEKISVQFGNVKYDLDADNIFTIKFLREQIGKPVSAFKGTKITQQLSASNVKSASASIDKTYRNYRRGSRGGCYYINSNGKKTYVDRSLCK